MARNGIEGLILATLMSGLFLIAAGFLRLGKYIKYIPYPVTVGFTAGIGVIIFSGEIHDLLGLTTQGKEPGPLVAKLTYLYGYMGTISAQATAVAVFTIAVILLTKTLLPNWPGLLIAVILSSAMAATLGLHVETIGTRFGGIPDAVPVPHLPRSASTSYSRSCPTPSPSRCLAPSNRCSRPSWRTACQGDATAPRWN